MSALVGVGRVGVAGWNTYRCWFETFLLLAVPVGWVVVGGLARCWVLRRHLRVQGFLGAASGLGRLTHPSLCGVGVVVAGGWGVVVC